MQVREPLPRPGEARSGPSAYRAGVTTAVLWFRRDLRLADHPALLAAAAAADEVVPIFVLDDALRGPSGAPRLAVLYRCLRELEQRTGGALRILTGDPVAVLPRVVRDSGAGSVHISSDHAPYGRTRDEGVAAALSDIGVPLVATGSPYGVTPGQLVKADGSAYKVYTPYYRAWTARGLHSPARQPRDISWSEGGLTNAGIPEDPELGDVQLPPVGELAARARWKEFLGEQVAIYHERRNLPGVDGTSRLSVHLKYGCLHPRTLIAGLPAGEGAEAFRREIVFRDFYADVLWQQPRSARHELQAPMAGLDYDTGAQADRRFDDWAYGRTGYPIVDAGMRQLLGEAWMHNRVRMIVGSFLTKDLHLHWRRGARWFMQHLRDGDLASNQQGWQWVAGTGTDPSPYFRVFNPIKQGRDYDPAGDYIRRWVPELREVAGTAVHEPWTLPGGPPAGYPALVVDHPSERAETLRRYAELRERR